MEILIHCPIAADATSFYRGFGPFNRLAKTNNDIKVINGSAGFEYNWHTLQNIDVVFLQRPSTNICLGIIEMAKRSNKPVWIDYDDDYIKIPSTNPRHDLYADTQRQAYIRECIAKADMITVSTEYIKKSLLELPHQAEIIVVPNAVDFSIFSPKNIERTKTVLWRGGDTHARDAEVYKEAMLHCFEKYPEYTWVFYGHKFDWMLERNYNSKRILHYEFTNLMAYFSHLMQIRPEIMVVPLEDNHFNRAKSAISWQEGTLAGATVMASALPVFDASKGCAVFEGVQDFIDTFSTLAENPKIRHELYIESIEHLPGLDNVNTVRKEIMYKLSRGHKLFSPNVIEATPWDGKRFFEYALLNGYIQENENYKNGHHAVADWLINKLSPESMIEFGCGPGPMLERFLMSNVPSIGLEINDYFIDYFRERNPVFSDCIMKCDFAMENLDELTIEKTDLGISIEVFEHIDMPDEWWDSFVRKLSESMKYLYFSSTPYQSSVEFDRQWGHVNVRPTEAWVSLFKRNGWNLVEAPGKICAWDLLFESTYNEAEKITKNPSFEKLHVENGFPK